MNYVYAIILIICMTLSGEGKEEDTSNKGSIVVKTIHACFFPIDSITPGMVNEEVTVADLSKPSFIKDARKVSEEIKLDVLKAYDIPHSDRDLYEIDHRVPLECGGANDIKNLWAQPWHINVNGKDMGAKCKDRLENKIHQMIITGKIGLKDGQELFLSNWTEGYLKYVGQFPEYIYDESPAPQDAEPLEDSNARNPT